MAQPGAVVDIVGAEPGAHQLLEQIGFLVGAFGRTEPGQRIAALAGRGCAPARRRRVQRLLPGRLAEIVHGSAGSIAIVVLRRRPADQRPVSRSGWCT